MEDRMELNVFLNKLVTAVVKKFENVESGMKDIKAQMETLRQTNNSGALKSMDERLRNLEMTVNSMKSKSQIDTSILKLIETEEGQRKVM
jgi:hypothetical protein